MSISHNLQRVRRTYQVVGEGRDLLEPADNNVVDTTVLTFLQQRVVDLTYEEDERLIKCSSDVGYIPEQRM